MTFGAGIGRTHFVRQCWPWYREAVVGAIINLHISSFRHVATDALRANRIGNVPVVIPCLISFGLMARLTKRITRRFKLGSVWIVTICTGNAGLIHLALHEGTVDEYFVVDLAVCKVEVLV